jgi:RNA 3'-terminal phosphate cyclase (ATP)
VAEEAVAELLAYRESECALDRHLADQIILPAALAGGASEFTAQEVTGHLVTCAAVVERFDLARVEIAGEPGATGRVKVAPRTAP